jgi:SAM-dependent methyltransferase
MRLPALLCLLAAACGDAMPADRPVMPTVPAQAVKALVPPPPEPVYGTCERSPDGIGKTFMDREIAEVMGHQGAGWLERPTREREERTDVLVRLLGVKDGSTVADIGCGSGYFCRRIAERAPGATVLGVDIEPEMLEILVQTAKDEGFDSIKSVLGRIDDCALDASSVDVVLMVDAYHEFSEPWAMLQSIRRALRPGGMLVLVEYREEDPMVFIKPHHKMSEAQARRELEAAGFWWAGTSAALPQQHVMFFTPSLEP